MGGNNERKINIRRSDSVATLRRLVGAEIAGAHNNDWRRCKQIARMLFRGDLLISVTVQGILMNAKICAKKIYVFRPSILIKSVWFLHQHGGGRVESLVKK